MQPRARARAQHARTLKQTTLDTSLVINEVNLDYMRTLNKIVLAATHARHANSNEMLAGREMPPPPAPAGKAAQPAHGASRGTVSSSRRQRRPCPRPRPSARRATRTLSGAAAAASADAKARTPRSSAGTNFQDVFKEFMFNSFLTKPEIIKIVVNVRTECLKMLQLGFFAQIGKSVRVDEYGKMQNTIPSPRSRRRCATSGRRA